VGGAVCAPTVRAPWRPANIEALYARENQGRLQRAAGNGATCARRLEELKVERCRAQGEDAATRSRNRVRNHEQANRR